MTQGKNPGLKVGGKRGAKKRTVDPLSRKEWYDFRAPIPFSSKSFGKTLVTKSSGNSREIKMKDRWINEKLEIVKHMINCLCFLLVKIRNRL